MILFALPLVASVQVAVVPAHAVRGAQPISAATVVAGDFTPAWGATHAALTAALPANARIDALSIADATSAYFSLQSATWLPGFAAAPADVICWDGNAFSLCWEGSANGLGAGLNVDALEVTSTSPLVMMLSLDGPAHIPAIGVVASGDLLRWEAGAGFTSVPFSAAGAGLPPNANLTAFSARNPGEFLVSFDRPLVVAGVAAGPDALLAWYPNATAWGAPPWMQTAAEGLPPRTRVTALEARWPLLNPSLPTPTDTDGDGKPDEYETASIPQLTPPSPMTNLLLRDSDGDGLTDGVEDPRRAPVTSVTLFPTSARRADSDLDGWTDGLEARFPAVFPNGPLVPDSLADSDNDGLPDLIDSDNLSADGDGDGYSDAYEASVGTDQADPASRPAIGDADGDGDFDVDDVALLANAQLGTATLPSPSNADLTRDGILDLSDLTKAANFRVGLTALP